MSIKWIIYLIIIISFGYILPSIVLYSLLKKCNEIYLIRAKSLGIREVDIKDTMFGKIDRHIIYWKIKIEF